MKHSRSPTDTRRRASSSPTRSVPQLDQPACACATMRVSAVRTDEIRKGTEDAERADRDEKLHFDLRSRIERSLGAPCEMRLGSERGCHIPQCGDYFSAVRLEDLLLVAAHEVDVELPHTDGGELSELRDVIFCIADHTEALHRLIVDKGRVR